MMNHQHLKPLLQYSSCTIGDAELIVQDNLIKLLVKGESWMGLDLNTNWQAGEFLFELNEAFGVCVTTGLGLGIIQTFLTLNPNVTKVYVYEKSREVIDIFYFLVEKNNFDISKIEIINLDANKLQNITCDCLFLDHFEHESEQEIMQRVSIISQNNSFKFLWYWPAISHFVKFCSRSNIAISNYSYQLWKDHTKIHNLPSSIDSKQIEIILQVKNIYVNRIINKENAELKFQKNNLLKLFGSKNKSGVV